MAFANFFEKAALSAASLLRRFDVSEFRSLLDAQIVGVAFDEAAAQSREGRWSLELVVDLMARFYPNLAIAPLGGRASAVTRELSERLSERAIAINPAIEILPASEQATIYLAVGDTRVDESAPTVYVGSLGWIARVSADRPQRSGQTDIPFGAAAAACLGTAAVFRAIFARYLPSVATESVEGTEDASYTAIGPDVALSTLDFSTCSRSELSGTWSERGALDVGDCHLVGTGAIGNAVVWALARTPGLVGTLHCIDDEAIDLSNLQRYVLTSQESVGASKATLASEMFERSRAASNHVVVVPHEHTWARFMPARGSYAIDRALLALDSAADRVAVQASLPRWVANAWTQPENLGVSRHDFLGPGPCVACLYLPSGQVKSRDQLYAEALAVSDQDELMEVRKLLHSHRPVGRAFLERAALRMRIPVEPLLAFETCSLAELYARAVCGGVLLRLGAAAGSARAIEVPMAFQSALAGILLAAELVADAGALRRAPLPARSELDLLRPPGARINSPALEHSSGRCLCQDEAFRRAYRRKYGEANEGRSASNTRVA